MDEIASGQERTGNRMKRVGFAAAAAVGLTLGAAGIAAAATDPSPSPSKGTTAQTMPMAPPDGPPDGRGHHGGFGRGPGGERGMGLRGALHGELVVPKPGGGYQTIRMQRGTVTAVDATSLTVKSEDKYASSYVLNPSTLVDAARDGISTVKVGDTVGVEATVTSGTATAKHVRDITTLQAERKELAPQRTAPSGTPASPSSFDQSGDIQGA